MMEMKTGGKWERAPGRRIGIQRGHAGLDSQQFTGLLPPARRAAATLPIVALRDE
jgi:hypothetical protein